jgi:hypothetical protein
MFRTPNLEEFHVTWYLQPSQFPSPLNNEEFIANRFIEDIMDGRKSISLVIEEVQIPDMTQHRIGFVSTNDVAVGFRVLTTKDMARQLIELGYKVRDRDEPEGITWQDLKSILRGTLPQSGLVTWDKEVRATDDNDPHAPWFRVMSIKHDDDGIFLAIEEIQT